MLSGHFVFEEVAQHVTWSLLRRRWQSRAAFWCRAVPLFALLLLACGGSATNSARNGDGDGHGSVDGDVGGTGGMDSDGDGLPHADGAGGADSGDPSISSYCQGLLDIDATPEYEMYCADDPTYDPDVTPMGPTRDEYVEDLESVMADCFLGWT